jgi:hypothetical protein
MLQIQEKLYAYQHCKEFYAHVAVSMCSRSCYGFMSMDCNIAFVKYKSTLVGQYVTSRKPMIPVRIIVLHSH